MADRVGALSMFWNGLKVVLFSLPLMLPVLVLNGFAFGWLDHRIGSLIEQMKADPSIAEQISQVVGVVALVLAGYLLIQVFKYKKASRVSWLPTLLLPSAVILTLVSAMFPGLIETKQDMIVSLGFRLPLELAWTCTIGGLIYGLWVCLSYTVATTGRLNIGDAIQRLKGAGLGFLAPHGGATLLIYLGMQVLLPGIFYAVMFAFVTHAAILMPEESPFKNSSDRTLGYRQPIVFLFLLTVVPAIFARLVVTYWAEKLLTNMGLVQVLVTETGAFDGDKAFSNLFAMLLGAPWPGSFYSEGIALIAMSLMTGIAAAGLTWGFLRSSK